MRKLLLPFLGISILTASIHLNTVFAQETSSIDEESLEIVNETVPVDEDQELAQVAEALANPLSYLWLAFIQNDTSLYDGDLLDRLDENKTVQNTLMIQPVLSIQLTESWKTIIRPVIPINSFETVDNVDINTNASGPTIGVDLERETGLGDIVLWTAFSNSYTPPYIYGFGPTVMLPTATEDQLGSGKWSAGPMGLAIYISKKWILGLVAQHWWSFAGEDKIDVNTSMGKVEVDRSDVNLTDVQYIIRYRYSVKTNIGAAPNIRYNWETDEISIPIGIGGDTLLKMGNRNIKVGAEVYYYVASDDDYGPEWMLRLLFIPVLEAPEWSRSPLF